MHVKIGIVREFLLNRYSTDWRYDFASTEGEFVTVVHQFRGLKVPVVESGEIQLETG